MKEREIQWRKELIYLMSKALTTPMREIVKSEGESKREGRGEIPMR